MQEYFRLVEGVSLETANIIFDKAVQKVIKDAIKHAHLMSTALYLLYLITIFYLITTFVVLLVGAEVADKAISSA
jgi:hypothetical protein